jgi:epoxyqueuosine reductase
MPAAGNVRQLTQAVKAEAIRLGFTLVGVTSPEPTAHLDVFLGWVQSGRHGEMAYLATPRALERRADPRRILPECQSILVLAAPYDQPIPAAASPDHGQTAAYAWGSDYHEVFAQRLSILAAFIGQQVGAPVPSRWYTDTGPLLERDLAQRAGLGWVGKNTCLINPEHGSYFLLAELLLGIELEQDAPFTADRCGACTRCLDACPTACILPDRTLDARRCISYLTIELKSQIPIDLRKQIGAWVFGCDVCQQVCPWNQRFAARHGDLAFAPQSGSSSPDLVDVLALTPEGFNQRFKGSPVKRAKRRGLLRNAAVALGNTAALVHAGALASRASENGGSRAVLAVEKALLNDPEPLVRQHAAWALGQVGGESAIRALQQAVQNETSQIVITEIRKILS